MSASENHGQSEFQLDRLKGLVSARDPGFFNALREETHAASTFARVLALSTMRRRALLAGMEPLVKGTCRLAIVGGASLRPLANLIEHYVSVLCELNCELWLGDFDNYVSEILVVGSEMYEFKPDVVLLIPSEQRCRYSGSPADTIEQQRAQVNRDVSELLSLASEIHGRCKAEVLLANFRLPCTYDPGPMRVSNLSSDYAYRKCVNLELGLRAPAFVTVCDVEFLANRLGTFRSSDPRTWFESKQPYSSELITLVSREVSHAIGAFKSPAKKVVVLDLDNTLWGGVVGDDGLEGIEIGTTSPRGEAFRAFQQYLLSLTSRGILLAVSSKNDYEKAVEPFLKHPEMVLRLENIVNFKANWEPKSENIKRIATELNLGLDSLVFVDDNPAEIEIVRQFAPQVSCVWVGDDPAAFSSILQDSRLFEVRSITNEDSQRAASYQRESQRQELQNTATDIGSYLASLEMSAYVSEFTPVDVPRITQLINKSNQFNLTTRRRTESEVVEIVQSDAHIAFTIRLCDRFGEHGLIAIVIAAILGHEMHIDTWIMSCRVLKRQVELATMNELVRLAQSKGCRSVIGFYRPTPKNSMVKDHYTSMGFALVHQSDEETVYSLEVDSFVHLDTNIVIVTEAYANR